MYELLFQSQKDTITLGRGGGEVNGLAKNSKPENCNILDNFTTESEFTKTQTHYLVVFQEQLIHLRVCDAYEGSGYDEFAVILFVGDDEESWINVKERFERMKRANYGI